MSTAPWFADTGMAVGITSAEVLEAGGAQSACEAAGTTEISKKAITCKGGGGCVSRCGPVVTSPQRPPVTSDAVGEAREVSGSTWPFGGVDTGGQI